jgi:two-component system, NtrC family, sensor kinase
MGSRPESTPRLRVALIGGTGEENWSWALGGVSVEVVPVADPTTLPTAEVDLVLAATTPEKAAGLLAVLAGRPNPPPVTLLVGSNPAQHPHARLLDVLVEGKRDWMATFDAIVDPVALISLQGAIVRANLGFATVVGRRVQEITALDYVSLVGEPEEGQGDPIARSLADGTPRTEETRYQNLPGVQQVTTSPLLGPAGEARGLVVIIKDVTDLKMQQERMLQASRLADIGLLAAGVAHEINTPLASIALRAESLLRSAEDERLKAIDSFKNFPRYLKTIDEEIYRCKRIISALLEFSRSRRPEVKEVDLNALAERAAELVSHQMKLKQVTLALKLETNLPRIDADEGQLRQSLIALLMNALDATGAQGHVSIETKRETATGVSLSVIDDGAGIPAEHLDKVFSPFFTTKPLGEGTGLGLAIVHGIVTSHGGEVHVDSEVGRGTRISLFLPTRSRRDGPPTTREPSPNRRRVV